MNNLNEIDISFSTLNENKCIYLILHGSDKFDGKTNQNILKSSIKFIKESQRFDDSCCNYLSINVKRICVLFTCIFWDYYVFF